MPANLPPPYIKAEAEYRRAGTAVERLERLREMYRLLPKHKGTEKLQADLKQKMSRARDEIEEGSATSAKKGPKQKLPRDGAGRVVLVGAPNVGKSALLGALTRATPEVAPYPFTTHLPQPGMMSWEDVSIQLIDLPPITMDYLEPWSLNLIRSADAALLIVDLAEDDAINDTLVVLKQLAGNRTELVAHLPFDNEDEATISLPTVMVATKRDASEAEVRLELLQESFGAQFPLLEVSTKTGSGLDALRRATYDLLGVMRVYTKVPGKPADMSRPFTLPIGSGVWDLARLIHSDVEQSLKFAKVWGTGVFEGQTVKRDHELHDADVVELHL